MFEDPCQQLNDDQPSNGDSYGPQHKRPRRIEGLPPIGGLSQGAGSPAWPGPLLGQGIDQEEEKKDGLEGLALPLDREEPSGFKEPQAIHQPQSKRFLCQVEDADEIAESAEDILRAKLTHVQDIKNSHSNDALLQALVKVICSTGLYSHRQGKQDQGLRASQVYDLRYNISTTVDQADLHSDYGPRLQYEYENKDPITYDTWYRLCLIVSPKL